MGLRGPTPKPSALKVPGELVNPFEPLFERVMPRRPAFLSKAARKEWRLVAPMLFRVGILNESNGMVLAMRCQAVANLYELEELQSKSTLLVSYGKKDKDGKQTGVYVQQGPLFSMIKQQRDEILRLDRELGMTPAGATRIMAGATPMGPVPVRRENVLEMTLAQCE